MNRGARERLQVPMTSLAPWLAAASCYSTLGLSYTMWLAAALVGGQQLRARGTWRPLLQDPVLQAFAALWLLLALSACWTPAPPQAVVAHLWTYALPLMLPLVAAAWTPAAAQAALRHFVVVSALVALLNVLQHLGVLPDAPLWQRVVDAEGNQRIANSLLMSLGAGLGLCTAFGSHASTRPTRTLFLLAALLCVAGLAMQDRRSGMLTLPLLLVVLVLARQRRVAQRLALIAAVVLLASATWQVSDSVRARFAEGLAELRAPRTAAALTTSWGQRRAMLEMTSVLVAEQPWLGHGVASWPVLWQQRTEAGTPLHGNTTPHNEYLMVATQSGAIGLALLLAGLGLPLRRAWRQPQRDTPALLIWSLLASAALFNAVLRDAKFSLPLLLLAALASAAAASPGDDEVRPAR